MCKIWVWDKRVEVKNTYSNNDFCTILTNAKQSGNDEEYLQEVDGDACPHKAEEIKYKSLHDGNLSVQHNNTHVRQWLGVK